MTLRTDMGSLLEEQANSRGDRPFIKMAGDAHWMTYGAFNERANRLAHGVRGLASAKVTMFASFSRTASTIWHFLMR